MYVCILNLYVGMTAKEFKELLDEVYEVQLAESPRRAAIDVLEVISKHGFLATIRY